MKISYSNTLTQEQKQQITELENIVIENDKLENRLFLSNEINFDKNIPVFFMAYDEQTLVGFLTFFIPSKEEAEISAVVHPAYRQKGVFTALDKTAREVIAKNTIGRILYCAENKSESALNVLKYWGITEISRSEYRMKLDTSRINIKTEPESNDADFCVKRITPDNKADYLNISERVYGNEESDYVETIMTSETRMGYVFYRNDNPIGIFVISSETKDEPFIYGVAVAEDKRGMGYGRKMMQKACEIASRYGGTVWLDVDSENPAAFHLYKSIGFEITFQADYYLRNID